MQEQEGAQYSLDTLCIIASFWPAPIALAFTAAQPRCRLTAEVHAARAGRNAILVNDRTNGRNNRIHVNGDATDAALAAAATQPAAAVAAAAWDVWASQLPFGEWWVSDLAERVMPSERVVDEEAFVSMVEDELPLTAKAQDNSPSLSSPPLPPLSHAVLHGPSSQFGDSSRPWPSFSSASRDATYYAQKAHRVAVRAQYQSGVLDTAVAERFDACGAAWPDCPYPGDSLWSTCVRAGVAGGVSVGHVTSYLVPSSSFHLHNDHLEALGDEASSSALAADGMPFYRVLHWDLRAERLQQAVASAEERCVVEEGGAAGTMRGVADESTRSAVTVASTDTSPVSIKEKLLAPPPHRKEQKDTYISKSGASPSTSEMGPDAVQTLLSSASCSNCPKLNSWTNSHWWFCRPLHWSRINTSPQALPARFENRNEDTLPQTPCGVPRTCLHVYGTHPESLPDKLRSECDCAYCKHHTTTTRTAAPKRMTTPRNVNSTTSSSRDDRISCSSTSEHQSTAGAAFVTAVHFHDCSAPSPLSPSAPPSARSPPPSARVGRLQRWLEDISRTCSCAWLVRLELNMEDCEDVEDTDEKEEEEEEGECQVSEKVSVHRTRVDASAVSAATATRRIVSSKEKTCATGPFSSLPAPLEKNCSDAQRWAPVRTLALFSLTEVYLSGSTVSDVNFLSQFPSLRVADLSLNTRLRDAGVRGLSRSRVLRVLDLSYCVRVDGAVSALVTCATLEELYLSGTGITDATVAAVSAHYAASLDAQETHESGSIESTSRLRVLHLCGCRQLMNPFGALAGGHSGSRSRHGQKAWWRNLEEFRTSLTALCAPTDGWEDEGGETGEEGDERAVTEVTAHGLNDSSKAEDEKGSKDRSTAEASDFEFSAQHKFSSSSSIVGGAPDVMHGTTGQPLTLVSAPPASFLTWPTLKSLILADVTFHCPLRGIGEMPSLEHVSLLQCRVAAPFDQDDDASPWLDGLQHCTRLHTVLLDGCEAAFTRGGSLQLLAALPALATVSLHRSRVTDADVRAFVDALHESHGGSALSPYCAFQQLSLSMCGRITRVSAVATLPSVRVLEMSDTSASQELVDTLGLRAVDHMLQIFKAAACSLVHNANPLAALRHLRWLDLSHTPVTTAGVAELRRCPALTHLNVKGCAGISHLRDVLSIPTLQVLIAQGAGLHDESAMEDATDLAHGFRVSTPRHRDDDDADDSFPHDPASEIYSDIFPAEDRVLCASVLHTLLLSHTRVRRVRRLGLLSALSCLDLSATAVTNAELAKFVCTGIRRSAEVQASKSHSASALHESVERGEGGGKTGHDRTAKATSAVVHTMDDLCSMEAILSPCAACHGPPLRVLSLQLCRAIFTVGVLGLCPRLAKLDISSSNVTSRGLVGLQRSRSLQQLRLQACKGVHDMRVLGYVTPLREIDGSGCNVHADRLPGAACSAYSSTEAAADAFVETSMPPTHLLNTHSDLFQEGDGVGDSTTAAAAAALRDVVEGCRENSAMEMDEEGALSDVRAVPRGCSPPFLRLSCLRRLVLDGCVNVQGGGGGGGEGLWVLGRLPHLLELSLRNCSGITSSTLAELTGAVPVDSRDDSGKEVTERRPLHLFPALRALYVSSCRNLTGSLAALEALPRLQRVHAEHCGFSDVVEVMPSLRQRVSL